MLRVVLVAGFPAALDPLKAASMKLVHLHLQFPTLLNQYPRLARVQFVLQGVLLISWHKVINKKPGLYITGFLKNNVGIDLYVKISFRSNNCPTFKPFPILTYNSGSFGKSTITSFSTFKSCEYFSAISFCFSWLAQL
jgi:hypothetical protein